MGKKTKVSKDEMKVRIFIKGPRISREDYGRSAWDFETNFKPVFDKIEAWRRESASSQIRVC